MKVSLHEIFSSQIYRVDIEIIWGQKNLMLYFSIFSSSFFLKNHCFIPSFFPVSPLSSSLSSLFLWVSIPSYHDCFWVLNSLIYIMRTVIWMSFGENSSFLCVHFFKEKNRVFFGLAYYMHDTTCNTLNLVLLWIEPTGHSI